MYNSIILFDKIERIFGRNCLYDTIVYHEKMYHKLVHEILLTQRVFTVGYASALRWDL